MSTATVSWHYVSAAVIGTSHFNEGAPCLDDCLADVILTPNDEVLIAVAAEGRGARAVCESFVAAVTSWLRGGGVIERLTRADAERWIHGAPVVAAIAGTRAAGFLQIGGGAIVITSGDSPETIFRPDGTGAIRFEVRLADFHDLAVMTDGLQHIAPSLFAPMLELLQRDEPGYADDLEPELVALLISNAVNEQTDDDKALILATRGAR